MHSKGFTIIELLAVIIIISVISIVGVIAVSSYTEQAHKDVYINDAKTYIKAARDKYNSDKIAQEPKTNEALVIPIETLDIDKSVGFSSPYADFILNRCYVIVTRVNDKNTYYIALVDQTFIGIDVVEEDDLSSDLLITEQDGLSNIKTIEQLRFGDAIEINGKNYIYLEGNRNNPNLETFLLIEDI